MKYGEHLKFFLDIEEESGKTLPPLQEEPDLCPWLIEYWRIWKTLTFSRQIGFGVGYIPYSEIICYLNEKEISDEEERDRIIDIIQMLDCVYVKEANKKKPKKTK